MNDVLNLEQETQDLMDLMNKTFDMENDVKHIIIEINKALVQLNILYAKAGKEPINIEKFVLNGIVSQNLMDENHTEVLNKARQKSEEKSQVLSEDLETENNENSEEIFNDSGKGTIGSGTAVSGFRNKINKAFKFLRYKPYRCLKPEEELEIGDGLTY